VTIIFGFTRKNVPLLCGDTLVTRIAEHPTTLRLPASGPLHPAISETFRISVSMLRQKVNVIDDAVTLAWSGPFVAAVGLAKEIKSHIDRFGPSAKEIRQILAGNVERDLSCIAMVAEGEQISYFWSEADTANLRRFENVCCAGSGSKYFKQTIAKLDAVDPITDPAIDNFTSVLCDALTFASQSMGRELYTQQNLIDRWGGAIELCYRAASGFVKLDKIAFAHFRYDEAAPEAGLTGVPRLLLKRYNGPDVECMARQCEQTNDPVLFSISHDDTVVIPPLISGGPARPLLPRIFDYHWLCTHFSYCRAGKSLWSMTRVNACPNGPRPFRVTMDDSNVDVTFTNNLGDWMREQIRAYQQDERLNG
jgi:hypothetical protein